MEREVPRIGHIYEKAGVIDPVTHSHRENHTGIPGEKGVCDILVTEVYNMTGLRQGLLSQVRVDRGQSVVPSTFSSFAYTYLKEGRSDKLISIHNYIYIPGENRMYLAEKVTEKDGVKPFPDSPKALELMGVLRAPKPGEAQDFGDAIEKLQKLRHAAFRVQRDGSILLTRVHTDIEENITLLIFSILYPSKGSKPHAEKLRTYQFWGIDGQWALPAYVEDRFIFERGINTGMVRHNSGDLIFSETYKNPKPFIVDGVEVKAFEKDRDYGEWAKRESGFSGEYGYPYVSPDGKQIWYKAVMKPL